MWTIAMTINDVNRSDIMKRAWKIYHRETYRTSGTCLFLAWDEVKQGRLVNWHHLSMQACFPMPEQRNIDLKREMFMLDMQDSWETRGLEKMQALRQEVSQWERMVGA